MMEGTEAPVEEPKVTPGPARTKLPNGSSAGCCDSSNDPKHRSPAAQELPGEVLLKTVMNAVVTQQQLLQQIESELDAIQL